MAGRSTGVAYPRIQAMPTRRLAFGGSRQGQNLRLFGVPALLDVLRLKSGVRGELWPDIDRHAQNEGIGVATLSSKGSREECPLTNPGRGNTQVTLPTTGRLAVSAKRQYGPCVIEVLRKKRNKRNNSHHPSVLSRTTRKTGMTVFLSHSGLLRTLSPKFVVPGDRIELPTRGFSVRCSTN